MCNQAPSQWTAFSLGVKDSLKWFLRLLFYGSNAIYALKASQK